MVLWGAHEQLLTYGEVHGTTIFANGGRSPPFPIKRLSSVIRIVRALSGRLSRLVQQALPACSIGLTLFQASELENHRDSVDQLRIDTPEQIALELPLAASEADSSPLPSIL